MSYDRVRAVGYACRWALDRNPGYYNFDKLGGDCTNFVSQCLCAGGCAMNYTPDTGWYYRSLSDRSAAWTGAGYLYNFLTGNRGPGPYGTERPPEELRPGDIIQLSFDDLRYSHSLLVVKTGHDPRPDNILLCTHTFDSLNRPLDTYSYKSARGIEISGSRQ